MASDTVINLSELAKLGAIVPAFAGMLEQFEHAVERLVKTRLPSSENFSDPWLTAEQARKYLGGMSKATFDKYRYETTPRLTGHRLDGKSLYKQSELDNFVRLYAVKSSGFA